MTNFFIAPGGSDSNDGLTVGTPWLTPNHAVNCGDVITAAAGTYVETNFRLGNWGTVTCPAANNVAWLKCATPFACNINVSVAGHNALGISRSFWGVQGWVVSVSTFSTNQCFQTFPPDASTQIHHIIFANNIANGCGDGAFTIGAATSTVGVDYVAFLGNIAYNGAQDPTNCYSGIDVVPAINSDTLPGTHIYIAGNFAYGNVDPNPCAGGLPTDGHGISLDSNNIGPYTGQIVVENNISIFNGGTGFQNFANNGAQTAPVFVNHNTFYGNQTGGINANPCAEINYSSAFTTSSSTNLVQAGSNTCHGGVAEFALGSGFDNSTDSFTNNFIFSSLGNNTNVGSAVLSGNVSGASPRFANPVMPPAPNCTGFATVPACMATVVANFTPTNNAALAYGYQVPSTSSNVNPYYPKWLCTVTNLPAGLVTPGCSAASGVTSGKLLSGKILG